jgi:glycosyltransferase involved in cell wall biosynthesis
MPVYNCAATVAEAIASILNQTLQDWELIVYDDGSRDATLRVARGFSDPRIHILEGVVNRGLAACLNETIVYSRGKFFARMDGDDISYPTRLQRQVAFLESHSEVEVVAGSAIVFRSNGQVLGVRRGPRTHEQICAHPCAGFPMVHPTWTGQAEWFRRHLYRAGMMRMEDWELLFRTHANSRFANLAEVILGYREDVLSLRKILVGREHKCRVLLRSALEGRAPMQAMRGIFGQCGRSIVDLVAIGSHLDYRVLKHRALPVSLEEVEIWLEVIRRTQARANQQTKESEVTSI